MKTSKQIFDRLQGWFNENLDEHSPNYAHYWSMIDMCVATLIIIAFALLSGCKSQKPISNTTTQQQSLISERYDSAHTVAGDSATAALLFRCDSMGNVYLAELATEQGRRLRLELQLGKVQAELKDTLNAKENTNSEIPNYSHLPKQNEPLLLTIDCKEDSFEVVIRGLRERIAYYEENKERVEVPVRYIPDYYRNCTRGFWALLVLLLIALALLVWKNWAKIAAWALKVYARFRL